MATYACRERHLRKARMAPDFTIATLVKPASSGGGVPAPGA
ncbi:MAG: hypothetical protein OXE85_00950 [Roseovarius sp.]|nr:hypothetical protein [Roseovarius sp.]